MIHRRTSLSVVATTCLALAACGDYTNAPDPKTTKDEPTGVPIDLEACPALDAERTAVIFDESGLRAAAPDTPTLAVWLREAAFPPVPKCDGAAADDRNATCAARDEALDARIAIGVQELECVLASGLNLTDPDYLDAALAENVKPVFWEAPYHLSDGSPVPVMRAFRAALTWPLVEQLARHPYVEKIEAMPGEVPFMGTLAPPPPDECPREREDPAPKLVDAVSALQGNGRQSVVLHMSLEGIPAQVPCASALDSMTCADLCDEFFLGEWDRYIVSTRHLTCLGRELDAVVAPGEYRVAYDGREGSLCTPLLLGAGAMVITDMGRALTWSEAEKIAAHPYVGRIFPVPIDPPSSDGCPLDTTVPVPVPECSGERESAAGKWSEQNEALWSATPGPHEVGLTIRGGTHVCAPTCPPRPNPCPSVESADEYMTEWNRQSQRCVRELITAIGGAATDEVLWIINAIWASLTWEQIQLVAEHPHVERISSAAPEPPP